MLLISRKIAFGYFTRLKSFFEGRLLNKFDKSFICHCSCTTSLSLFKMIMSKNLSYSITLTSSRRALKDANIIIIQCSHDAISYS